MASWRSRKHTWLEGPGQIHPPCFAHAAHSVPNHQRHNGETNCRPEVLKARLDGCSRFGQIFQHEVVQLRRGFWRKHRRHHRHAIPWVVRSPATPQDSMGFFGFWCFVAISPPPNQPSAFSLASSPSPAMDSPKPPRVPLPPAARPAPAPPWLSPPRRPHQTPRWEVPRAARRRREATAPPRRGDLRPAAVRPVAVRPAGCVSRSAPGGATDEGGGWNTAWQVGCAVACWHFWKYMKTLFVSVFPMPRWSHPASFETPKSQVPTPTKMFLKISLCATPKPHGKSSLSRRGEGKRIGASPVFKETQISYEVGCISYYSQYIFWNITKKWSYTPFSTIS